MRNEYAQSITDAFSEIIKSSNRKPNLLETDDGNEFVGNFFNEFLNNNNIKKFSRYTDEGAVFAERIKRTIGNLSKRPVFEKGNANWLNELSTVINKYIITFHRSIKMTPVQASRKSNEKLVYSNLHDNRELRKPKFNLGHSSYS